MRSGQAFGELVFPHRCLGCGLLGEQLCTRCLVSWNCLPLLTHVNELVVYSAIMYSPVASRVLLAAKENGILTADNLIVDAMRQAIARPRMDYGTSPLLVPIPSQRHAIRKRGRDFLGEITTRVAGLEGFSTRDLLLHRRRIKDQSILDAQSRHSNLHNSLVLKENILRVREAILIDDLVTTGATLSEASRALKEAGFSVLCAVTACVAQPLR
ncbi:MAG: hypothetical protein F2927_02320 [Actinobacteria bacterium]|uniref:Unannotated protein n=1 Tax=freshwater metagenome TaxID=449393 RepID=A0A6J7T4Z0_9ZZZZ|nr:hypothetical protein [Actinomycetota bacterium]MTA66962.1 hypothetical protein [Actinomycetota bacterium]MTB15589.1 hypothetical protein [Actinomycetota bacterium]